MKGVFIMIKNKINMCWLQGAYETYITKLTWWVNIMMTLQQIDMNILLWIQEHLRIDALTPFWESDHFPGKWRMVLACSGSSTADLEKNTQDRKRGITFHCNRIPDHKCTAQEYGCPPETFWRLYRDHSSDHQTDGLLIPVRSYMRILCMRPGLLQNAAKEIWSSCSNPGRHGSFFQTLSWCTLSGRCSGRISRSSIYKYTGLSSGAGIL